MTSLRVGDLITDLFAEEMDDGDGLVLPAGPSGAIWSVVDVQARDGGRTVVTLVRYDGQQMVEKSVTVEEAA